MLISLKKKKRFGDFVVYQFLLLRQQRAVLIGSVLLSPNMLLFANGAVLSILTFFALSSLAWSWSRVNIVCLGLLLVSIYPVLIASWAPSLGDPGYITKWWLGAISSFVLFFSGNSLRYILWSRSQEKTQTVIFEWDNVVMQWVKLSTYRKQVVGSMPDTLLLSVWR